VKKKLNLAGFGIALLGAILFSTKAIFVKLAFHATHTDAITLLGLRMLFSLPFYVVIAFVSSRKEGNVRITPKQWFYIALTGMFGYYISSLFDFIGLQYITAGLERLILFLYPTFSVLLNTLIFKEKLSKTQIIALLLTYLGIGIAYYGELKLDTSNPNFFYGSLMVFLCSITYSFYLVGTGRLVNKVGATRFTTYAMLFATLGIFTNYGLTKPLSGFVFTPTLIGYGCALAIIATVIPSFMISNAIKKIGSNNVSIITSIGPVSTIVQAHFLLGEKIFLEQILGTILVVIGVLLIGRKSNSEEPIPSK
jgi:drug/metabolite transporter (DMT)-like permease